MNDKISTFWTYVRDNHHKIIWSQIQAPGTETHSIYMQMLDLFHKISDGISLNFQLRNVLIEEEHIPAQAKADLGKGIPVLVRQEIVLSSNGNSSLFPIIDKIYESSHDYFLTDDWLVVKYFSKLNEPKLIKEIPLRERFVSLDEFFYCYKADESGIDLVTVISEEAVKKYIECQECINILRNNIQCYLEKVFGEYNRAIYIVRFTLVPYTIMEKLGHNTLLSPLAQIMELDQYMEKRDSCRICKLEDYQVKLNEDKYCQYCQQILCRVQDRYPEKSKAINDSSTN